MKTALITGISGQDGSYLAELLLSKGYEVVGLARKARLENDRHPLELLPPAARSKIQLEYTDLLNIPAMAEVLRKHRPDEVYNLAAQSYVSVSFQHALDTAEVTGLGALKLLEAIRLSDVPTRFYQASSSEMFGKVAETPQRETTPFHPRSPYGSAKAFAHHTTINYREAYGMFNSCGILFNHESPRRGQNFVTRKITLQANRIKAGQADSLMLGNLEAKRDWGYAGDFVEGMWKMLQHSKADDFVLATGETHSVKEFCQLAFSRLGLDWEKYVKVDPQFFRPADIDAVVGDASKAKNELGWTPKINFNQLVDMMVDADTIG